MKLNNKGFTMVEMLAAVAILAIVSGIAVSSYTRYQENARNDSYEAMEQSAFSAAQSYILEKGLIIPEEPDTRTIEVSTLVDTGYLSNLEDPRTKGDMCHAGSTVKVSKKKSSGTTLEQYTFLVTIKCNGYTSSHVDDSGNTVEGKYFKS